MILQVFTIIVTVSAIITAFALLTQDNSLAVIASVISSILWIILSIQSFNIQIYNRSNGSFTNHSEPAISFIFIGFAVMMLLNMLPIIRDWIEEYR